MIKRKQAQHEIVGFVLIVLIVSIVGVIFLSLAISKGKQTTQQSVEVSNLLQSAMYYTTNCEVNYAVQYREMQDLIKECYKNPNQKCLPKNKCELQTDSKTSFIVKGTQGPWEHQSPKGNAKPPVFVSDVKEGDEIRISDIQGTIYFHINMQSAKCRDGNPTYGIPIKGGFYDNNNQLIKYYDLRDFENGIKAPAGATKFYAYIREFDQYKGMYTDNAGTCTFNLFTTVNNIECINQEASEETVCQVLESDLKNVIEGSLNVGEDSPNKAYRLKVYYSALDNTESDQPEESILNLEKGIFQNCTSIIGGSHTIIVSSFSSGAINVELESCTG